MARALTWLRNTSLGAAAPRPEFTTASPVRISSASSHSARTTTRSSTEIAGVGKVSETFTFAGTEHISLGPSGLNTRRC
jgi:hypothetical protein